MKERERNRFNKMKFFIIKMKLPPSSWNNFEILNMQLHTHTLYLTHSHNNIQAMELFSI